MKKFKKVATSLGLSFLILGTGTTVLAATEEKMEHVGNWESYYYSDYNGLSEVGTQLVSSTTENVLLYVYTGTGATIGQKSGWIAKYEKISHKCWGQPGLARKGRVRLLGTHNPYFEV